MADVEIIELGGVKIPLDPEVLSPAIIKSLRLGRYENSRVKTLLGMIDPGERIVDVGSGMGFIPAFMALPGKAALIVGVDGHPALQAYADRLYRLNGVEVTSRNALVVTRKTTATERLYLSNDFWGSSMIPDVKDQTGVAEVATVSFGELIADYQPTMLTIDLEVMREYLRPDAASRPLEAMELAGVEKVLAHIPMHLAGQRGIKRVFDFFSAQDFYYNIDHSRGGVVLFSRIQS